MNIVLSPSDLAALSPLLILLAAALIMLLIESFAPPQADSLCAPLTAVAIVIALGAVFAAPQSDNALITPWVRFDALAKWFTVLFLTIGLASTFLAWSFFQRVRSSHGEFFFLLLSSLFGLVLIGIAADFLTLFLGLETLSISLYILCTYIKRWEYAQESAMKYFILGSLAAAFLLYGIALVYGAVGTLRFEALLAAYQSLSPGSDKALFLAGIALVTVGLAFKAAVVPFHIWAPDVYDGAPTPVTAFMAVGTKAGAFAALAIVFLVSLPHFDPLWNTGAAVLSYLTLIYANFVALQQTQLRRFFAYSGISHAGFLLMPIIAGGPEALPALLFYIVVYTAATLGAFAVLSFVDQGSKGPTFDDLRGLFQKAPYAATTLAFCLLTLAGIPPTAGFLAKFYVFKVAFQAGYPGLVVVGLLTAVLSAFYYLRIVSLMFTGERDVEAVVTQGAETKTSRTFWPAAVVAGVAFVTIVFLSLYPAPLMALIGRE